MKPTKKLTEKDYKILYQLINYHLNLIGEVGNFLMSIPAEEKFGYMYQMEILEGKLADLAFPKPNKKIK